MQAYLRTLTSFNIVVNSLFVFKLLAINICVNCKNCTGDNLYESAMLLLLPEEFELREIFGLFTFLLCNLGFETSPDLVIVLVVLITSSSQLVDEL